MTGCKLNNYRECVTKIKTKYCLTLFLTVCIFRIWADLICKAVFPWVEYYDFWCVYVWIFDKYFKGSVLLVLRWLLLYILFKKFFSKLIIDSHSIFIFFKTQSYVAKHCWESVLFENCPATFKNNFFIKGQVS